VWSPRGQPQFHHGCCDIVPPRWGPAAGRCLEAIPAIESNVTRPRNPARVLKPIGQRRTPVFRSLAVGVALLGCVGEEPTAPPEAAAAPPRHVVLITLDTTRADALGVYGQLLPATPNIDRMSGEGLRFSNVMTASPSTFPSHATIMTGKFPPAHGVRSNAGYVLPAVHETLAEALSRNGFVTAAEIAAPVIGRRSGLDQGFDVYRDTSSAEVELKVIKTVPKQDAGAVPPKANVVHLEERMASDVTDRAIEFIGAHKADPFFLWLHYFDPHAFYAAPAEFRMRITDPYLAEVSYADSEIGRVLGMIRRLEIEPETLVVLTADHGEGRGQHDEDNHAFFVYDTTMRVPLILWGSSLIRPGTLVDSLVRTVDIAPTVVDLLGLPPLEGAQGQSLAPLIRGTSKDLELAGYGESAELVAFGSSAIRTFREGRWKYIHKLEPELYDVVADPGETSNLASSHPEIVERLRARMAELVRDGSGLEGAAEVPADATMRLRLQSLGYAALLPSSELADSLSSMELSGTDPSEHVDDIRLLSHALGAEEQHRFDRAAERFVLLWQKYHTASFGLYRAEALIQQRKFGAAIEQLEEIVERFPDNSRFLAALGDALIKAGRLDDARKQLSAALGIDRCDAQARALLANVAFFENRYSEQHEILRVGVLECPRATELWNNYAYALATSPDAALRDGQEALRLASAVTGGDVRNNPAHIDTLAAAHAELGDFEAAIAASNRSIQIASESRSTGGSELLDQLKTHRSRFSGGQALRDPSE